MIFSIQQRGQRRKGAVPGFQRGQSNPIPTQGASLSSLASPAAQGRWALILPDAVQISRREA